LIRSRVGTANLGDVRGKIRAFVAMAPLLAAFVLASPVIAGEAGRANRLESPGAVDRPGDVLARGFAHPPDSAKPHTWWHWINGNITKEGITADLEAMNLAGIGGAQIFNVDNEIPAGPVKFMSAGWREMVKHAVREAARLGLEICVHNCAGWSSSGGPWVRPGNAMQVVVTGEVRVRGPARFDAVLARPRTVLDHYRDIAVLAFPAPAGEEVGMAGAKSMVTIGGKDADGRALVDGRPETVVSIPRPQTGTPSVVSIEFPRPFSARALEVTTGPDRQDCEGEIQVSDDARVFRKIRDFSIRGEESAAPAQTYCFDPVKARFYRIVFNRFNGDSDRIILAEVRLTPALRVDDLEGKAAFLRAEIADGAATGDAPPGAAVARERIVDLTGRLGTGDRLKWDVPEGEWVILRIGHTPLGRQNHPAPEEGRGLECDKLSASAMDDFFSGMMRMVLEDSGPLARKTFNNALIDSYEVGSQNWTPRFVEEFRGRRGYDPVPFLPVLTGRVVDSPEVTDRFLWDFRRTIADLFADNYYGRFGRLCHDHGLKFSVEPYGNGPFEDLACGGRADIVMGEFWTGGGVDSSCSLAASAAHTYGRQYVGAEAFTSTAENGRWTNTPWTLKALGDSAFCAGVNRLIFHRYAHQPWPDLRPGMTMGPWGFHFERTITWWGLAASWTAYLARCQYLLQQGLYAADACYFCGSGAPVGLAAGEPWLPPGYKSDGINSEVLLNRVSVRNGRLVLPDGMSYRVLVLPPSRVMTPELLRKVREFVREGAVVVGPKPDRSPSLKDYPRCDGEVKETAREVWGSSDGKAVKEHAFGRGKVYWGTGIEGVFKEMKLLPDFESAGAAPGTRLSWIHRVAGGADVYFVSNQRARFVEASCLFRVSGKRPELWHPDTGIMEPAPVWREEGGRTRVDLRLDPAGSVFVVFRGSSKGASHVVSVSAPEVPASPGGTLEILKAVYEAKDGAGSMDVTKKLAGLVKDGALSVEVENDAMGRDPAFMHFKRLSVEYSLDGKRGSCAAAEHEVLEIPPALPGEPPSFEVSVSGNGGIVLASRRAGTYELRTDSGRLLEAVIPGVPDPVRVSGPWELRFPPKLGAPESAVLEELVSWTDRTEPGIKYFSGTAVYARDIEIPGDMLGSGKRLFLDLGRVKDFAEPILNGRSLVALWKPPFLVEVTDVARAGKNRLEVKVTNLWPNRLIGDEQEPDDCAWTDGWGGERLKDWPGWLVSGTPRPSGRIAFTTWKHYRKDSPLLESGLLGPVRLVPAVAVTVGP